MKNIVLIIMLLTLLSCRGNSLDDPIIDQPSKEHTDKHPEGLQTNLRMFGYLQVWNGNWDEGLSGVNLDQVTDLCISFINPDIDGSFTINPGIVAVIDKANKKGVRVFFAIGGGGGPVHWDNLLKPNKRTKVISNIRKVLTSFNFDGIDVDLENERITEDYNDFVIELSDSIKVHKKLLSVALARYQGNVLSNTVYSRLDYLNVMCYDKKADDVNSEGNYSHSSLKQFEDDFKFFEKKIAPKKINMGVPGYAWENDNQKRVQQISLKDILKQFPKAYCLNYKLINTSKSWWFDGHPVLRQKVKYAFNSGAGGLMIWQMMHDPKDDSSSLLKLMNYCAANPNSNGFDPKHRYLFVAKHSQMFMEGASKLNLPEQNSSSDGDNQRWIIQADKDKSLIINVNSNLALTEDKEELVLAPVDKTKKQQFDLIADGFGYYKVVSVSTGRVLTVKNAGMAIGERLILSKDETKEHQRWIIYN